MLGLLEARFLSALAVPAYLFSQGCVHTGWQLQGLGSCAVRSWRFLGDPAVILVSGSEWSLVATSRVLAM